MYLENKQSLLILNIMPSFTTMLEFKCTHRMPHLKIGEF